MTGPDDVAAQGRRNVPTPIRPGGASQVLTVLDSASLNASRPALTPANTRAGTLPAADPAYSSLVPLQDDRLLADRRPQPFGLGPGRGQAAADPGGPGPGPTPRMRKG